MKRIEAMRHGLSVRAALWGAFVAIALAVAAYAAWSVQALNEAQTIVERTFDRSMVALNATRAAEATASRLPDDPAAFADLEADLRIVAERAPGEAAPHAAAMADTVRAWSTGAVPKAFEAKLADDFLVLSELLAGDAYIEREAAVGAVAASVRMAWLSLLGVALAAVLFAAFLSRSIVAPLTGAARAAGRIAEGDFAAPLPRGHGAEVRTLLRSMGVMQTSIARMMAAEAARAETAEALLAGAIENAADGVVLLDPQGRIVTANARAEAIVGLPLPKDGTLEQALTHETGAATLIGGGEVETGAGAFVRSSRAGGEGGSEVVIWADITDIREREAALKAASDAKSRFIATISHELKTPLNAVIGFSDLLRSEAMGPIGNDQYKTFATEIHKAGSGLLGIISDILGFVSAQGRDYAEDGDDIDLARLATRITETMAGADEFGAVEIACEAAEDLPTLIGHELTLTRALSHLLENAAHFAAKGGGHVTVSTRRTGPDVRLVIEDDGPGMDADGLARAQGVFGQVDDSLTRKHEGAGLGIPFARSVIEAHGGRLEIDSQAGVGTRVSAILPVPGAAIRQVA